MQFLHRSGGFGLSSIHQKLLKFFKIINYIQFSKLQSLKCSTEKQSTTQAKTNEPFGFFLLPLWAD